MHDHPALFTSWNLVRGGAFLALAAVAMVGIPVSLKMVRTAFVARPWDVVYRLLVPLRAAVVTLIWMISAARLTGGHWARTPWDVTGNWTEPSDWPSLTTRWALSSVTFVLMILGLVVSAITVKQAIGRSDLSAQKRL